MGTVVDDDAMVVGYDRVHVCDASVFPSIPDANTHLPTTMLAERLVARWRAAAWASPREDEPMATRHPYSLGLHEIGDGLHAYLQPDGGWGWSNAGLIVGDGVSLLVDTLFDLRLTAAMLDSMTSVTAAAPVASLVNTHANGDHCYGNSEVTRRWAAAEIVASTATAHEMADVPPSMLAALNQAPGEVGELFRSFFGEFHFEGIELEPPTRTFDHRLSIDVGGRDVELIEVGPGAHCRRHHRPRARCLDRVHRRHPLHRGSTHRVGRPAVELGRRL